MTSQSEFDRAQQLIPGGVNSPVRAFRAVGGTPRFFERASGAYLWDVDGRRYIDYVGSWGPMIAGHTHPSVVAAVQAAAARALSFGAPTPEETRLAELLCQLVPSIERVRLVSSGTEATMTAIRIARGFTGRSAIVKFEGCYHGHADALLVKAGSGALTFGHPSSAGVPAETAAHTLVLDYNDISQVRQALAQNAVAAVIVEPVAGNMNLVLPADGFLQALREECTRHGALLIFDEVMTGFRVALGGAQAHYRIRPDLTTLGKVIGGGLPLGAVGGRRDVMEKLAPLGPVYQAGTLSGNPLAMAAGIKAMEILARPGSYERLEQLGRRLGDGLAAAARAAKVPACVNRVGSMLTLFFCAGPVTDYASAKAADTARFAGFFRQMRDRGVFLPPSQYEAMFVSLAHTEGDIDQIVAAARAALAD